MKEKISVIGIGRLGLAFALLLDSKGYDVCGCDINEQYVESLKQKTFKSDEPQVNELLATCGINFTTSYKDVFNHSPIIFILVPTPSKEKGEYDHKYIEQVVSELEKEKAVFKTLIISCTVMPGYCLSIQDMLSRLRISVVYSPFLIAQGTILNDLKNADVVLVGGKIPMVGRQIYIDIMDKKPNFKYLSLTGAEIVKIAINCFLSIKIAYANLLGTVCLKSGVSEEEMKDVLLAIGADSRIGNKFISYGYPASGVCLPRDTRALNVYLESIEVDKSLINGVHEANSYHMDSLKELMLNNADKNKHIQFNQLSYKPNVPIITESRHLELCIMVLKEGYQVEITESEKVINQVKPILKEWDNQINYISRQ